MMFGSTADHSHLAPKGTACGAGCDDPSPTLNVVGSNSSQYPSPCGPVSLIAVESAFHARKNPASMEMKDWPACVFSSVTRRIRVPNVGSAIAVLAGPKAGGGGSGFGSVPVYAGYVDGELADCGLGAAEIVHTKDTNNNPPMPTEILIRPPKILTGV